MSPAEVLWRARDQALQAAWTSRRVTRDEIGADDSSVLPGPREFAALLPDNVVASVPEHARKAVLAAADQLMQGQWEILGVVRTDLVRPDWFHDPVTGMHAPADRYCFRINHRAEAATGNIKQIWELSRLQHLTLLATAWFLSRDDSYARRVVDQLQSWWADNPFLSGVHWTSGIEVGIRLINLAWIRRLLDGWPPIAECFEGNKVAVQQIWWHQKYLAAFRSRGTSANNHVIAEAAGLLVASCAFPWFQSSDRWRRRSVRLLENEIVRNTFPSGIDRELASDYHCFVAELGILAAIETAAIGRPVRSEVWQRLCAMVDSGAALLDERLQPPRQGDGDEGRAILLDAPVTNRWPSLLATGGMLFGALDWWPHAQPDVASSIVAAMPGAIRPITGRAAKRPWHFGDAGTTLLRTRSDRDPEIWCRCDGGPHGFLKIAAHAHADALSVEVRYGGVDILADPGTYCYHGDPTWRSYFRSTIAHNTIELDGRSQSAEGGPFLWLRHANGTEIDVQDIGDAAEWTAQHDGYSSLASSPHHRRCVRLDRASRIIDIVDEIEGGRYDLRLAFHLGPEIQVELGHASAVLRWPSACTPGMARLELPNRLHWSLHRGENDPILGWYSSGLGRRTPAFTLIGSGQAVPGEPLSTRLEFLDAGWSDRCFADSVAAWYPVSALGCENPTDQAEAR